MTAALAQATLEELPKNRRALAYLKGLASAIVLGSVLVAFPIVLSHVVGWPLPRHVPNAHQLGRALAAPIPDAAWPKGLAAVGWVAWGWFALSCVVEAATVVVRREAFPRPRWWLAGGLAAVLVASAATLVTTHRAPTSQPDHVAASQSGGLAHAITRVSVVPPRPAPVTTTSTAPTTAHLLGSSGTSWLDSPSFPTVRPSSVETAPAPVGPIAPAPPEIPPSTTITVPVPSFSGSPIEHAASGPAPATARTALPRHARSGRAVRLGPESFIGGAVVAALVGYVGLTRLRRRHDYVPSAPEAGCDLGPEPLSDALRRVCTADRHAAERSDPEQTSPLPRIPEQPDATLRQPETIEIGTRDGETVRLDIARHGSVGVRGPAADSVVRHWLVSWLTVPRPGTVEILCTKDLLSRLVPRAVSIEGIRAHACVDEMKRTVEIEMLSRTRRIRDADVDDVHAYRFANPEDPLPTIVVVLDATEADEIGGSPSLTTTYASLCIVSVILDAKEADAHMFVDEAGRIISADPASVAAGLVGAEAFRVGADDATGLLTVVDAEIRPVTEAPDTPADAADHAFDKLARTEIASVPSIAIDAVRAPSVPLESPSTRSPCGKPIQVQLLGNCSFALDGEEVRTGLRNAAIELFAWFALRPDGGRAETPIDDIWPDVPIARGPQRFWTALGNLRSRFRSTIDSHSSEILIKVGDLYHLDGEAVDVDLWRFQSALKTASGADDDSATRSALEEALSLYSGAFAEGRDFPWCEVARADLHRRALDAYLALADVAERYGDGSRVIDVLERAIALDRYAEEPYRRLMIAQARLGNIHEIERSWRLLKDRLDELDLDVDEESARLYRQLTHIPVDRDRSATSTTVS